MTLIRQLTINVRSLFGVPQEHPKTVDCIVPLKEWDENLHEDGWVVVTGGGPGNMEAANKGALSVCAEGDICSIAQAIHLPFEEAVNEYVQEYTKHQEILFTT